MPTRQKLFLYFTVCAQLCWIASIFSCEEQYSPNLVIHLDVNGTIFGSDSVQNKSSNTMSNESLAKSTIYPWDGQHEQSFFEFKKERSKRLESFPDKLNETQREQYDSDMKRIAEILEDENTLYPSFYQLVEWLNEKHNGKYAINLRTFGSDLKKVVPIIESNTNLRFKAMGAFDKQTLKFLHIDNPVKEKEFTGTSDIYEFLSKPGNHCAIQDSYPYWKDHQFQASGGKFFPVDVDDPKSVVMFLDDNANEDRKIIHPINLSGELEDTEALVKSNNIVAVNRKEAIFDNHYFIKIIKEKLEQSKR